ncbi:MAG: EthD domain-containing protein [Sphingomonadaceae bacterium]
MTKRVRRRKAILLIGLKESTSPESFRDAFRNEAQGATNNELTEVWSLPVPEREMPRIAHQVLMEDSPPPFDAVVQLASDSPDAPLADRLEAIANRLAPWIDRSRSAVLVGEEIKITTGDGAVQIVMPLRRRPELTHDQFMEHWFERHADLGEAVEGVRYRQNHVDYSATDALRERLGFTFEPMDGLTESYFGSSNEAFELMSREEVAIGAIEDEKRFIDHSRSQFGFYRIVGEAAA